MLFQRKFVKCNNSINKSDHLNMFELNVFLPVIEWETSCSSGWTGQVTQTKDRSTFISSFRRTVSSDFACECYFLKLYILWLFKPENVSHAKLVLKLKILNLSNSSEIIYRRFFLSIGIFAVASGMLSKCDISHLLFMSNAYIYPICMHAEWLYSKWKKKTIRKTYLS